MKTIACAAFASLTSLTAGAQTQNGVFDAWLIAPNCADEFDENATGYSSKNAFLAACMSTICYPDLIGIPGFIDTATNRARYRDNLEVLLTDAGVYRQVDGTGQTWKPGWGFDTVSSFRSSNFDAEGFIASTDDFAVISFRGSETSNPLAGDPSLIGDWLFSDLNAGPVPFGGGLVHGGFFHHAQSVWSQIEPQLRNAHRFHAYDYLLQRGGGLTRVRNPLADRPIWITGHSLGGAAAVLTAYYLKQRGFPVRGVYTIGQPSCANQQFANSYLAAGLQLHRVVHGCDFVARSFAELSHLPYELQMIPLSVASEIANAWPAPINTSLQITILTAFTPQWLPMLGLSIFGQAAQPLGLNATHFGTLRYFDRNGVYRSNWSEAQRRDDRIAAHRDDILELLEPLRFPTAPSMFAGSAAWANYWQQLNSAQLAVNAVIANPGPFLGQVGAALYRPFGDHSAFPHYVQRLHDRADSLSSIDMTQLPGRPWR